MKMPYSEKFVVTSCNAQLLTVVPKVTLLDTFSAISTQVTIRSEAIGPA